jgi:hypothetical protein
MFLKTKARSTGTASRNEMLTVPELLDENVLTNINIGIINIGRKKVVALFRLRVLTTNLV